MRLSAGSCAPFTTARTGAKALASVCLDRRSALIGLSRHRQLCVMAVAATNDNLLIVGPGVLGSCLGKLWKDKIPDSRVVGQTLSTTSHERLKKLGIEPRTAAQAGGDKFSYVCFSAPPSGSEDYAKEVEVALSFWDGTGSFVFTGSNGLSAVDDGGDADEDSPVSPLGKSPGNDKLLNAEKATLAAGGNVIRLVGLYHRNRGAHTFFLKMGKVPRWGGYVVNLIHYEDAAGIVLAALSMGEKLRGKVLLGADNHPVTFQDMMAAVTASPVWGGGVVEFTGTPETGGRGKRVNNDKTRALLGWRPKYESFEAFAAAGADDFYSTSGLY